MLDAAAARRVASTNPFLARGPRRMLDRPRLDFLPDRLTAASRVSIRPIRPEFPR